MGLIRVAPLLSLEHLLQCYIGDEHGGVSRCGGSPKYTSMERNGGSKMVEMPMVYKWG